VSADYLPHYHWAALLAVSVLVWCWQWVKPRYGLAAAALLGYAALSSVWVWVFVQNRYVTIDPYNQMALRYFSCDSIARLFLLLVPLMALAENRLTMLLMGEIFTGLFVTVNSLMVISTLVFSGCGSLNCGGLGNPSIMVGAVVCALPLVVKLPSQWPLLLLAGISVLASQSSVALGLFGIYLAYAIYQWNPRLFGVAACASVLPLGVGALKIGMGTLFSSGDRFPLWGFMISKWAAPWNILAGTGLGTYHVFSINLQAAGGFHPEYYWNTLHNDWLQMLFEGGLIGAFLIVATYFAALKRALLDSDKRIAMSLILYGIYMGVNPALHHAIPALFGAWLFLYALKRQPHTYKGACYA
jgi:hypothetical protein